MQGPCKQQETQHTLHQCLIEINRLHEAIGSFRHQRKGVTKDQKDNAREQADQHDPDRGGELEKLQVQISEKSGENE